MSKAKVEVEVEGVVLVSGSAWMAADGFFRKLEIMLFRIGYCVFWVWVQVPVCLWVNTWFC
ncbi:hypothetical protein ACG2F4_17765 [Halalkalibaculum sp. DA3122]|uniref:hypothetical protein n=1 Tax=Halalkalibaculum sp. DA3122 TaxID=3373607 RepID=UPI00375431D9